MTLAVGNLPKPKPHQLNDPNWAALKQVVDGHEAGGKPGRWGRDCLLIVYRCTRTRPLTVCS